MPEPRTSLGEVQRLLERAASRENRRELYEMLAGYPPFAGRAPLDALRAHVEAEPPPLPTGVPFPAQAVVERALQKRPDERYASAAQMACALAAACAQISA